MADIHRLEARLVSRSQALRRDSRFTSSARDREHGGADRLPAAAVKCRDCGGKILAARAAAVPGAERCVDCQLRRESAS